MRDFGSVLNCVDGRVQRKAADYLRTSFGVRYVDAITAPGMIQHIFEDTARTAQLLDDLRISMDKHGSTQVGVVAHADCAGNPIADKTQKQQLAVAVGRLQTTFPGAEIIGLWIDDHSIVERIRPI